MPWPDKPKETPIEMVIPEDYVLIFSRIAFIPKQNKYPELAGKFIDFLLSDEGQSLMDKQIKLGERWEYLFRPPKATDEAGQNTIRAFGQNPLSENQYQVFLPPEQLWIYPLQSTRKSTTGALGKLWPLALGNFRQRVMRFAPCSRCKHLPA